MLSDESATVTPLNPVPIGVESSCVCDEERGILSRDRFRGSSSVVSVSSAPCADVDLDLLGSSVDGGSREDVRMGSCELAFVVGLLRDDVDPKL